MNQSANPKCPYCGSDKGVVWVHGHGQCATCGINIEECCRGEQCGLQVETNKSSELDEE